MRINLKLDSFQEYSIKDLSGTCVNYVQKTVRSSGSLIGMTLGKL